MSLVKNHTLLEDKIEFKLKDGRVFYIDHDKIDLVVKDKYPEIYNNCIAEISNNYSLFDVELLYHNYINDLSEYLLYHSKLKL